MAQLVECPTLDFRSGHDLTVHGMKPRVRLCAVSAQPAWDSLFSPRLFLKINKYTLKKFFFLILNSTELAWASLSLPLSLPFPRLHSFCFSLSQNKNK